MIRTSAGKLSPRRFSCTQKSRAALPAADRTPRRLLPPPLPFAKKTHTRREIIAARFSHAPTFPESRT
jgi:hypothetical protein